MRWSGGTKSGPPCVVTRATKLVIADLVAPSFQDGSGSACASAELARSNPVSAGITASVESSTRRLSVPGSNERLHFWPPILLRLVA